MAETEWSNYQQGLGHGEIVVTDSGAEPWGQALISRNHVLFSDTTAESNGADTGPDPHELVLMALGACTSMTLRMYAARKAWPIERVVVRLAFESGVPGGRESIRRSIALEGPLDSEQRERLLAVAVKCPIHKLLSAGADIRSELADG